MNLLDLYEGREPHQQAIDRLEQARIAHLEEKMDYYAKHGMVKEFQKAKEERDSYFKVSEGEVTQTPTGLKHTGSYGTKYNGPSVELAKQKYHGDLSKVDKKLTKNLEKGMDVHIDEAGIGQDIVNKTEKMARATPQTKAGAVASTVKNAAKWLAGKGGPGKEGPTYEGYEEPEYNTKQVKVFKDKSGKPIGEIGVDLDASPGNDDWYCHHYATGYNVLGFDNAAEAKRELMYVHKHPEAVSEAQKKNSEEVAEDSKLHDLSAETMIKKARAAHPIAKDDAEALALYIADKEQRDVDRLERENEHEEEMIARIIDRLENKAVDEGWSNKMVARRTGQAPTPYSVYIKGKEWKSFADDDHAENVANKLRAKFKQEGKDPSVITIAPTGYDKDVKEGIPTVKTLGKDESNLPLYTVAVDCGEDGTYTVKVNASNKFGALATASKIVRRQYDVYPERAKIVGQEVDEARRVKGGDYQLKLVDRQEDDATDLDDVVTDYYFDVYQNGQKVGHAQGDSYYGELVVKADFNREFKLDTFHDKDHPLIKQFEKFQQQLNEFAPGGGEDDSNDLTDEAFKDGQRLGYSMVDGITRARGFETSNYTDKYTIPFTYGWNAGRKAKIANAKKDGVELVMKKDGSLARGVEEDHGSWIVYDPETKQIKKRFKTHTAGKSYAKVHGLGFASSEYYFDNIKQAVNELDVNTLKSYADKRGAQVAAMKADNPDAPAGSPEWIKQAIPAQQVARAKQKIARKERQQGVEESKEAVFRSHDIEVEYPEGKGHSHIYHRREPYRLSSIFSDANSVAARNRRAKISLFVDGEYIPNYEWQEGVDAPNGGIAETVNDIRPGLAKIYRKLAPKIERYKDSFLANQLYEELEAYAELHGAEAEFKRMLAGARNRAHMDYDTNPGGFQNWFWYLPFGDSVDEWANTAPGHDRKQQQLSAVQEDQDTSGVESAIIRRIMVAHTDWLQQFGPEKVMQAAEEVAYNVGDVDEIGSSDVSAYVHEVGQILGVDTLNEKWSEKYKRSINCAHPKGFSQRAHCAGRKK